MATFEYNALTSAGRLMKGTIEAGSTQEADELLKQMQLTVNLIEKAKLKKPKTTIGRNEFLLFNQQLASITKAGIPLERGLRQLSRDISSRSMRTLVTAIAEDLEAGVSIDKAFEKRQKHFPPLYGRILKAGVETGRLSQMLTSLNRHLEVTNLTRRIIFEAMTYPAVVLALVSIIFTLLFLFVIPSFVPILTEIGDGRRLPGITRVVLSMPEKVLPFWIGVGTLAAIAVVVFLTLSSSPAGRRLKESFVLKIPVIGRIHHSGVMSKLAEAMALMVSAGSNMPACLRLGSSASGSEKIILESEVLAQQVEQGTNILEAGQFCRMIPRLFLYSIQLGTQRNELQDNLHSLGQMYTEQARCSQGRLQAVLLPVLVVMLGVIVSVIVLAIFMPMVTVISALGGG